MIKFKQFIHELYVRNAAGKKIHVPNVKIRMADGTLKSLPPGKSGSSGGGGGSGSGGAGGE